MNKITKAIAQLNFRNLECLNPEFPSYTHIIYKNKTYPIKNTEVLDSLSLPNATSSDDTYHAMQVILSGEIVTETGHMPNPMVLKEVILIESIKEQ